MRLLPSFYPKFILDWLKTFWIWVKKQHSLIKSNFWPCSRSFGWDQNILILAQICLEPGGHKCTASERFQSHCTVALLMRKTANNAYCIYVTELSGMQAHLLLCFHEIFSSISLKYFCDPHVNVVSRQLKIPYVCSQHSLRETRQRYTMADVCQKGSTNYITLWLNPFGFLVAWDGTIFFL